MVINRDLAYVFSVLFYMPTLVISNVIGVKINFVLAIILALLATILFVKDKVRLSIVVISSLTLLLKFLYFGFFSIKELFIVLWGAIIFITFSEAFNRISVESKLKVVKYLIYFVSVIASIVFLQRFNFLPISIGAMSFENNVGVNLLGELVEGVRPSAYFYHPYDTALALLPLAILLGYSVKNLNSIFCFFTLFFVCSLLNLKILQIFLFIYFINQLLFRNFTYKSSHFYLVFALLSFFVLYLSALEFDNEVISFSAGRVLIWSLTVDGYWTDFNFLYALFGYDRNPLETSVLWQPDDFFSAHNQFLFMIVNAGLIITAISLYLFRIITLEHSELNKFLILLLITLAFTGDLFVYLSFWITMCVAKTMHWYAVNKVSYLRVEHA